MQKVMLTDTLVMCKFLTNMLFPFLKKRLHFLLILTATCGYGQENKIRINVNLEKTFQTIDHFGASDAWSCQFVGNWPEKKKNSIADYLFSLDTLNDGGPKGIGLSMWRF